MSYLFDRFVLPGLNAVRGIAKIRHFAAETVQPAVTFAAEQISSFASLFKDGVAGVLPLLASTSLQHLPTEDKDQLIEILAELAGNSSKTLRHILKLEQTNQIPRDAMKFALDMAATAPPSKVPLPARRSLLAMFIYLIGSESSFNPNATNPTSGAYGYIQILPSIARKLKVLDPSLPEDMKASPRDYLQYAIAYSKDVWRAVEPPPAIPMFDQIPDRGWRNIARFLYSHRAGEGVPTDRLPDATLDTVARLALTVRHGIISTPAA